ncbi:uncharacterized protein QYS62_001423 [Fusarium acuminatum]|uniref:Uncharacterized protein n=1 Tax=Fusarium acuminatum TaxID=5515 RepID=A0ABZ2WJA1_9HYPO
MNKDVATVLGNHFWMDPSFFIEYHRTSGTVSSKAKCNDILATSLATQPYMSLSYRVLLALPSELIGYFGLNCSATGRVIETTRFNGEFDSVAYVRRKCLIWSNVRDDGWDCIAICGPPLNHNTIRKEGPYKGLVYKVNSKLVAGGYVDFLPTNLQSQRRQVSPRTSLAQDLCFYLENYLTLPGLTPETPDLVLLFARKIVASLYSRHLDHVHQAVIRSQVPMRRHSDFIGLDLATVEANWSSRQTLEKPLHQYCYDLEHILAQMRVPLQRPDLAQVTSWRDVHVDFQMLHHRFENARNWVSKINASITGLTGIVGNRQAFREQQLSLEAAVRTQNITTLGLLFVPLAYVATLFSMSGEYGPGGDRFWLYFLIAFPVTMVVMVAFVAMGWVRERNIKR